MVSQPFVGTDGVILKSATMAAIKDYVNLDGECTLLNVASYRSIVDQSSSPADEEIRLPKVQIILATKSAEAGVNGKLLENAKIA